MRKTFDEIIDNELNLEENYSLTSGDLYDMSEWAKKLMKLVREKTIEECIKKAEVHNRQLNSNSLAFNNYWELDKNSLLKLDKESIEV